MLLPISAPVVTCGPVTRPVTRACAGHPARRQSARARTASGQRRPTRQRVPLPVRPAVDYRRGPALGGP
eukprot:2105823-Prymnesium_polylepis.1